MREAGGGAREHGSRRARRRASRDAIVDGGRRRGRRASSTTNSRWSSGRRAPARKSNMNMNEVLANRANELLGGKRGSKTPVHPNDDVNHGQSSNDIFPDRDAHRGGARDRAPPAARARALCAARSTTRPRQFEDIVKIGRTHLQDATPLTLGPGILGLRRAARRMASRASRRRCRSSTSSPSAAPPSARGSTRIRNSRERVAPKVARAHRPAVRHRARTSSRRSPRTMRWCSRTAR